MKFRLGSPHVLIALVGLLLFLWALNEGGGASALRSGLAIVGLLILGATIIHWLLTRSRRKHNGH
jgi:hypothetical protein